MNYFARFQIVASLVFILALQIPIAHVDSATITIRDGATIISATSTTLSSGTVSITPTAGGASHDVPANNVLGVLTALDATTSDFDISDLQYYSSFGSFYLNCITAPSDPASPLCGNWQYAVNGAEPGVGMDVKTLTDNDTVYIYYGNSRRVALSEPTVASGQSFTATAQVYDPSTNTFGALTGVTIGVKLGGTEVATSSVDSSGNATFTLNAAGNYTAGIIEDFYFPVSNITVTVPSPATAPSNSGGGGGVFISQFDTPRAISFLTSQQNADGSFASALLSDWAAIAFSVGGATDAREKLRTFFASSSPELTSVTDYERHAMALEALGINPYSGTGTDYVAHIVKEFDGTQIGDASLVNDDIFALFPLLRAGYKANDEIIKKIVAFIISKQTDNGSWENSIDITSATIQALSLTPSIPEVLPSTAKARGYLSSSPRINGGFGNEFSSAWTLQAIATLGDSPINWIYGTLNPRDYLGTMQQADGGVGALSNDIQTRIWATEYAIPAVEGKTWDSLLQTFQKPVPIVTQTASTTVATSSATVVATSTTVESVSAEKIPLPQKTARKTPELLRAGNALKTMVRATTTQGNVSQTAAVANSQQNIFLAKLWDAIISFLVNFF